MNVDEEMSLSTKVIESLAESEGVQPLELDSPLYDAIDPDILDQLDAQTNVEWELVFQVQDKLVQVTSSGSVTVDEQQIDFH